ncbi:hypothetical protein C3E78_05955 [Aeromicrobium chenweiae]|uniref:Uncharacterized protein n=1 Tax=Aeromicrobium chenweiae TaxID=2079793 RepID=A0A2S0WKB7_9ACTN|nr:hypothetical protein C3E78_05955 [Aeromicrobium chenweiae]
MRTVPARDSVRRMQPLPPAEKQFLLRLWALAGMAVVVLLPSLFWDLQENVAVRVVTVVLSLVLTLAIGVLTFRLVRDRRSNRHGS